ncbi:hypothetical protein RM545_03455 [Zunongwangia sp. F260]|uniref:EF-hand domain-containing protein n=1 Tax=Autumnicola lenta TaxID=3075593 RepID=A0ABU3CHG4_9FLAO|nr:hypothetical protein [Zunongwangia sp. F260]MDT0645736.1 hypothetical protein [Zunongwangia sp. F260]
MKSMMNFEKYSKYFFALVLMVGLASCDEDDDVIEPIPDPTGSIIANDQTLTNNMIMVQSVTVGQDSWLVALHADEEDTNNFITDPEMIEGDDITTSDIMLVLNEDANLMMGENEIVLKLYADDEDGILGEWDIDDDPITDDTGALATEMITVTMEDTETSAFADFDTNADGNIDEDEFDAFYDYDYTAWDIDEDGVLDEDEFYTVNFANADTDDDDVLSEDEWNTGYTTMYGTYYDDEDFSVYDTDEDGFLSDEEWNASLVDSPWFDEYDANTDTYVDVNEYRTGLYNTWDTDFDGYLNESEYNVYSPYYYSW